MLRGSPTSRDTHTTPSSGTSPVPTASQLQRVSGSPLHQQQNEALMSLCETMETLQVCSLASDTFINFRQIAQISRQTRTPAGCFQVHLWADFSHQNKRGDAWPTLRRLLKDEQHLRTRHLSHSEDSSIPHHGVTYK